MELEDNYMRKKQMIDLNDICNTADQAFWQEIVKNFPLATSGDFDFSATQGGGAD